MRQLWLSRPGDGSERAWLIFSLASALLVCLAWGGLDFAKARAQEPKADGAAKDAAPAKDAAAEADAPAKSVAAPAAAEGATPPPRRNMLQWAISASGPIGGLLLLLSIYFGALVIRLFMEFRVTEAVPAALVDRLEAAIRDKKFQDAYDACKDNESFLARLVRTGIANLPNGRPEAKEAMQTAAEEIVTTLEMKISYLAIIGTLGPMIGLVGTIWGMIMSFQEIANAAGAQPKPEKVAEGISTALFITLEGVSLSVPAIFFFAFFRNRIAQMTMEATRVADRTINSLVAAAKAVKTT
jgi:biopolymer transport protein ExbB